MVFDELNSDRNYMIFAGDTHGGQVRFPGWLWKILGYDKNAKYNSGLFEKGNMKMYVTRGIGTSHVRFRLFCPPEITVFHF